MKWVRKISLQKNYGTLEIQNAWYTIAKYGYIIYNINNIKFC